MRSLAALGTALVMLLAACDGEREEEGGDEDADSAAARRDAMIHWYNEDQPAPDGLWPVAYRKHVLETARSSGDPMLPPGILAAVGNAWTSLGPTRADTLTNGVTLHVTDSGRVRSVIADGSRLLVATSGGTVSRSLLK